MSLEAAIQENTQALNKLIAALAQQPLPVAPTATDTPAPASSKKTATKKTETSAPAAPAATPEAPPTYQQAADVVVALSRKSRDAAVAVLKQFGATRLPEIKAEQYAELIAACKKAGA